MFILFLFLYKSFAFFSIVFQIIRFLFQVILFLSQIILFLFKLFCFYFKIILFQFQIIPYLFQIIPFLSQIIQIIIQYDRLKNQNYIWIKHLFQNTLFFKIVLGYNTAERWHLIHVLFHWKQIMRIQTHRNVDTLLWL